MKKVFLLSKYKPHKLPFKKNEIKIINKLYFYLYILQFSF